jgi:3-methyladenine DNA glycosylase AlkD
VVTTLWNHPKRECQSAALDLLMRSKKIVSAEHMPLFEWMILTKSWWDTVDVIAPHCCGTLFQREPQLIDRFAEKWITSESFWLRRAALLFQLKYKNATDEGRLFHYILLNAGSDQFFIQKAIGWALREYSKTAPDAVKRFIKEHDELKPLSRREGMKWLNRP